MISVIVCTYNRSQYIGRCLEHLARQEADPQDYEVIVVDNNSTDGTHDIVQQFLKEQTRVQVSYHVEGAVGLSHARNRGIKESNGEILSFIDDDAFADAAFVRSMKEYFDEHQEVAAIGGKIIPEYEGTAPTWMSPFLLPLVAAVDMGPAPRKFPGSKFPIGANMAFRASVFAEFGSFDPALGRKANDLGAGEEKDLFIKLKAAKKEVHYVPQVVVRHIIPDSRLEESYIRRMGQGVGSSEKQRLRSRSLSEIAGKVVSEIIKVAGTLVLSLLYTLQLRFAAAAMLLKFRFWVLQGYLK